MSDDLADFFAKKAQKSKDKKKKMNVGDIAAKLERTARIQEQEEREDLERQQQEEANVAQPEDSEWIEVVDDDLTNKLEEIGIRGMDVSELTDEEEEEEEKSEVEPAKTWNIESSEKPKESERAENIAPAPKIKYVPPSTRTARRVGPTPHIDLKNEQMFPSIENAGKIEEEMSKAEEKKAVKSTSQGGAWKVQGEPEKPAREAEKPTPQVYRPPQRQTQAYVPPQNRETTKTSAAVPSNKYVVPNKRAQQPW